MSELARRINKKKEIAWKASPNMETYNELSSQIEVCEELCRPLTETQIKEFAQLSIVQIQNKIRQHKLA